MKINRYGFILMVALMLPMLVAAQSPYSKFGYGLLNDNATASQMQMGGVGYAMNSGRQINVMNPASYASIDSLTFLFDIGVDYLMIKQKEAAHRDVEAASRNQKGGGLDYVTMQVPIGKRFGASLGLVPFSSVGYSFGSEITNGVNAHEGQGGLNQLYLGFGGKVIKGLSVGVNVSYLFGNCVNDVYVSTDGGSTSLFEQVIEVRDYRIQAGVQYNYELNPDNVFSVGMVYTPGKTLLGNAKVTKYDINADDAPETVDECRLRHHASLPDTWGGGVGYRWNKRLYVEADVTYQPWSGVNTVKMEGFEQSRFADRYRLGLGAEFTPKARGNYLQRITYRAGGYYNRDYMMVGTAHVKEYGLGCGFGLPTASSKSVINVGFEYRHRQATAADLLKENYFCFRLGINFNELWFFQNKIR